MHKVKENLDVTLTSTAFCLDKQTNFIDSFQMSMSVLLTLLVPKTWTVLTHHQVIVVNASTATKSISILEHVLILMSVQPITIVT